MSKTIAMLGVICVLVIGYMPCAHAYSVSTTFVAGSNEPPPLTLYDSNPVAFSRTYSSGYAGFSGLSCSSSSFGIYDVFSSAQVSFTYTGVDSIRVSFDYTLTAYAGAAFYNFGVFGSTDPSSSIDQQVVDSILNVYGPPSVVTTSGRVDRIFTYAPNKAPSFGFNITLYGHPSHYDRWDTATGQLLAHELGQTSASISNLEIEVNPVPIPSAVWLLGSGLIGLVGIRRRVKK